MKLNQLKLLALVPAMAVTMAISTPVYGFIVNQTQSRYDQVARVQRPAPLTDNETEEELALYAAEEDEFYNSLTEEDLLTRLPDSERSVEMLRALLFARLPGLNQHLSMNDLIDLANFHNQRFDEAHATYSNFVQIHGESYQEGLQEIYEATNLIMARERGIDRQTMMGMWSDDALRPALLIEWQEHVNRLYAEHPVLGPAFAFREQYHIHLAELGDSLQSTNQLIAIRTNQQNQAPQQTQPARHNVRMTEEQIRTHLSRFPNSTLEASLAERATWTAQERARFDAEILAEQEREQSN